MKRVLIFLVILIIIGGVGYFLYNKFVLSKSPDRYAKQAAINDTVTATYQADREAVYAVTNNFFAKYTSCTKNPPSFNKGDTRSYCQDNTGFTTSSFLANLKKGGVKAVDPILCAQNTPDSVSSNSDIKINGTNASSTASENFGSQQVTVSVALQKINGIWKVDNITCPKN